MYYSGVIKKIIDKDKSPIKSINWSDPEEVNEIKKMAAKLSIKDDCKTIIKNLNGLLGLWVFKFTKDDVIAEQQNIIDKLCDAAAFFCAVSFILERKLSSNK